MFPLYRSNNGHAGIEDLWTLEAILNDTQPATRQVAASYHQPNRRPPLSTNRGTSISDCPEDAHRRLRTSQKRLKGEQHDCTGGSFADAPLGKGIYFGFSKDILCCRRSRRSLGHPKSRGIRF
jgi:hypothetical protein